MKQKQMTIIAVACGVLCALCVAAFMWSVQSGADAERAEVLARYGGEQVEICVATRDVAAGERVDASAIETRLWVADLLPDEAVADASDIIGKTATSSFFKGEVITQKRFEESRGTLDVPAGMQAVSVPAKAVQAVGGAILPGMSIDVYASGNSETSVIARGVVVLATSMGEAGGLVSNDAGWITLAVEPERVEEVISSSAKANLYFVLPGASAPEPEGAADGEAPGEDDAANAADGADEANEGEQPSGEDSGVAADEVDADGAEG